jgi:anti-sigma factor RsiW
MSEIMRCKEYRERLHLQIDGGAAAGAEAAMRAHAAGCASCVLFLEQSTALDAMLRDLGRAPVPLPALSSVRDIPLRPRPLPWLPDVLRAAAAIVPAVLVWAGRALLPEAIEFLTPAAIAFAGAFIIVTAALRPRLLGSSV